MIFNTETKGFETRSDKPNENWTGDDKWQVIPDGSELANKIIENYPFFDIVKENGQVVDITPTERMVSEPTKEEKIERLKSELAASDYKIIKCAECNLANLPVPYNIEELHTERQLLRDAINELEESL